MNSSRRLAHGLIPAQVDLRAGMSRTIELFHRGKRIARDDVPKRQIFDVRSTPTTLVLLPIRFP